MNDTQNTAAATSGQLGAGTTNSPQTTGGQGLADTTSNLQTISTPNLFTGTGSVKITQVGDGNFTSYTPENTTKATIATQPTKATDHHYPIVIASGVLIVIVLVISWLMARKQPSY